MKALGLSERDRLARFDVVESQWSWASWELEREMIPLARSEGVGIMAFGALLGGVLRAVAETREVTPAEVALAFLLREETLSTVVVGATGPEQLKAICAPATSSWPRRRGSTPRAACPPNLAA